MFRVSNFVVGLANTLVMLVGASAIGYSIYMFVHQGVTDCESAIRIPLLTTGLILFLVSLLGVIGSCFKENVAMVSYLIILFSGIVALMVFSIFLFFVTNKGAGRVVSGRGYKEYRTVDFSTWLNGFVGGKRWVGIRSCLAEANVCDDLSDGRVSQIADAFYHKNLSPIQSGCCKPPSDCNFEFRNATFWIPPTKNETAVAADNGDCGTWSNVQTELCFNCNACKAGVLANIREKWRNLLVFNICLLILLITVYSCGCCARRNNRTARKNGSLTILELAALLRSLGLKPSGDQIHVLLASMDANGNGFVEFDELVGTILPDLNEEILINSEQLLEIFKSFDRDGNGFISAAELAGAMAKMGQPLTYKELTEMIKEADTNGDGVISFGEFASIMAKSAVDYFGLKINS
ncbi:EF-hand domain [Arabidopsis suecica]|uniref:EF-hand domain n=1 Tax=Arabidopsis suecica TaxID=45249 RepID=A0A8T2CIR8_ARASU|nr:EF-hand domain [Arabidopsis suecica]